MTDYGMKHAKGECMSTILSVLTSMYNAHIASKGMLTSLKVETVLEEASDLDKVKLALALLESIPRIDTTEDTLGNAVYQVVDTLREYV